jgi:hypothetical protein
MSKQYPAGIISKNAVVPAGPYRDSAASGIWTLDQQAYWSKQGLWPIAGNRSPDPYFENVVALLSGNGSLSGSTDVLPFDSDASTNNFNLSIVGDPQPNNFTPYQGNGYYSNYFDGSGDTLNTASNAAFGFGSGAWTFEAWVYPTAAQTDNWIIATNDAGKLRMRVHTSGYLSFYTDTGNISLNSTTVVTVNAWSHVAICYDGTTLSLFQNGTRTATSTVSISNGSANACYIGSNTIGGGYWNGYISNARVVKGSAVYSGATYTVPTTPLTAISGTSLLTCQSNRFIDNSTNTFTLTVSGNTSIASAQPFTLPSSVATYGSGYFSGAAGSYLETPYNSALDASTGAFTYEAWLNPSTATNKQYLGGSVTNGFFAFIGSGTIFVGRNNVAVDFTSNATIKINQWNHVVIVRNSSNNIAIFINGSREYYAASNTNNYGLASNSLRIGVATTGSSYEYNGYISDVRIAKSALYDPTASTITIPTTPLTAGSAGLLTTQYNGAGNNNGFKDSSQNNFTITRNGNTAQGTFSPYGSNWSNYFDGSGDYLSTPSSSGFAFGTGDFTVEAWINTNILTGEKGFIQTSATAGGLQTSYTDGVIAVVAAGAGSYTINVNIGGTNIGGSIPITTGTWYHVAFTRSSGSVRLFINGALAGGPTTITANLTGTYACVGGYYNGSYLWSGYISNLRVVKGTAIYTSAFTPSTTPLTAISGTSLLTCADNRFIDDSTNNFTLTKNGDTSVQRFSPFNPTAAYSTSVVSGSAYFDASGDYLRTSSGSVYLGTNNFTLECWVYPTTSGDQIVFDCRSGSNSNKPTLGVISLQLAYQTSGANRILAGSVPQNAWSHLAIVRNSNVIYAYINGVQVGTYSDSSDYGTVTRYQLGADDDGGPNAYFGGYVSDARFVTSAVYTSAFTPPTTPLTAITNTSLLCNMTNAGILDNAMMNDLETVGNAQISTSVKKYGSASMYFDGSGDWLQAAGSPNPNRAFGTGDFTVEMWVYPTQLNSSTDYNLIDFRSGGTTTGFRIGINGSTIPFVAAVGGILNGSFTFSTNTWYHFAVTRSSGTLTIWINGTSAGSNTTTTNFTDSYLLIGSSAASNIGPYFGYIDDLRITKGVARYTTTFTPPIEPFINF